LSKKEQIQPFGLKEIANELKQFLKLKTFPIQIMGVLNINDDSFFEKSRTKESQFLDRVYQMIKDGANIIDIGAVSSRPGSIYIGEEEEFNRVKNIIKTVGEKKLYKKTKFSIDSYSPKVVKYALENGFSIVNDITGLENDEVCKIVAKYQATVCIMHMKGIPENMQDNPAYENVVLEVESFFKNRIDKANSFGIKEIILDVGIGFGKTLQHNLLLLKHQKTFLKFGYALLVGASRKSLIDKITPSLVGQRLAGTIALHIKALDEGASILRVHDVAEHFQAIKVYQALKEAVV